MKRFLFAPFLLFASLALASISFAVDRVTEAYGLCKTLALAVRDRAVQAIDFGLKLFATDLGGRNPSVRIVQAKAFVQRIIKRERPIVTASWRACPSI